MYILFFDDAYTERHLENTAKAEQYLKIDNMHLLFKTIVKDNLSDVFSRIDAMNSQEHDRKYLQDLIHYYCSSADLYCEFLIKCFSTNHSLLRFPKFFTLFRSWRTMENHYASKFNSNEREQILRELNESLRDYYTEISLKHISHILANLSCILDSGAVQIDNLYSYLKENLTDSSRIFNFNESIFSINNYQLYTYVDSYIKNVLQKYSLEINALIEPLAPLDDSPKITVGTYKSNLAKLQNKINKELDNISIQKHVNIEMHNIFKGSKKTGSIQNNLATNIRSNYNLCQFLYHSIDLFQNKNSEPTLLDYSNALGTCYASIADIERFIYLNVEAQPCFDFLYSDERKTPSTFNLQKHQLLCNEIIESSLNGFTTLEQFLQAWHLDRTLRITFSRDAIKVLSADYYYVRGNTDAFEILKKMCFSYEKHGPQFYAHGRTYSAMPHETQLWQEIILYNELQVLQKTTDQELKEFVDTVFNLYKTNCDSNCDQPFYHLLYDIYKIELHKMMKITKRVHPKLLEIDKILGNLGDIKQKYDDNPNVWAGTTFEPFIRYFLNYGFNENSAFVSSFEHVFAAIASALENSEKTFYAVIYQKYKNDKIRLYKTIAEEAERWLVATNYASAVPVTNFQLYNNFSQLRPSDEASNAVQQLLKDYFLH